MTSYDEATARILEEHLLVGPRPGQCRCGFGDKNLPVKYLGRPHSKHVVELLRAGGVLKDNAANAANARNYGLDIGAITTDIANLPAGAVIQPEGINHFLVALRLIGGRWTVTGRGGLFDVSGLTEIARRWRIVDFIEMDSEPSDTALPTAPPEICGDPA